MQPGPVLYVWERGETGSVALTACSGAERQICTMSARGFELATFTVTSQTL